MLDGWDLLGALGFAVIGWLGYRVSKNMMREERRKWRLKADAQFFALQVPAGLDFKPWSASIVLDEERCWTHEGNTHYELTRYARNEAGQYFMFVFNPEGKPFFKPVEPRIARVVLKDRYEAPGGLATPGRDPDAPTGTG